MKKFCAAVGFTALMMAGTAGAVPIPGPGTPIFSSYSPGLLPDQSNFGVAPGGGGVSGSPLSQQFVLGAPATLTDVILRLSDPTPGDGGSILVYLVPDGGGNQPAHTGTTLNGAILLGSILDSALPPNGISLPDCQFGSGTPTKNRCNTSVLPNLYVPTAGTYWISLVDGTDVNNGGHEGRTSGAVWWRSGDQLGQGVAGMFNSHVNIAGNLTSTNLASTGAFEVQINTPEPTSMALLGAGLFGLGLARRRSRKSAT